jgi:hypothetical protein
MALHLDHHWRIETTGDRMLALRVLDHPMRLVGLGLQAVQFAIKRANAALAEINRPHQLNSHA